ncbi:AGC family protein kinase [Trichomonas vaginalis G3]|uniref:AGC family protein kinase n=1 Tax=Trichomonas vaginalis (strain ATCC PRA-98 / G3) TaxID=412133 RepID=A2FYT0_TRIV3|nr:protein serine/threonine kinase protein [Trichomonas vaginalis G3]EAX89932.1 AGC family protein kinase [Trichomonas vaginalis G3]KAI5550222.1 protein serine/threonine kinase protein [Trichomonas vaginalis G3]|eukprot:XP_001302862.1 AGC family protein kinase [Trichomonas vaginalis G3]
MVDSDPIFAIEGVLMQKTNVFRSDRKLYGIVTEKVFSTFTDEKYQRLYKEISLDDIKSVSLLNGCRPGFTITLEDSDEELSYFCQSKHQAQKWVCALELKPFSNNLDLSDFEFIKEIGKGGSATVYVARNRITNELVAIKCIDKANISSDKRKEHIQSERNTLMRARHPFIIRLYNAFQTNTHLFFVLEFAHGGDLQFQLERNCFSEYQKKLYLAEIALAVKSLHSIGIIYRDLKPENILLDAKGHIKLADFGTAREVRPDCSCTSFCGTAEFLAPEVIQGKENQSFAIDWWSFGVVAYMFFVGSCPFTSPLRTRLFESIVHKPLRFPPKSVDPVTQDFISKLLEKNPAKRLGSPGYDIFKHPFWGEINWEMVLKCEYAPDFVPISDEEDPGVNFESDESTVEVDCFESSNDFDRITNFTFDNTNVVYA